MSVLESEILNIEGVNFESFTTEPSLSMEYSSHIDVPVDWDGIPPESPDLETSPQDRLNFDLEMLVENIKQGQF